jgi:hypothetical protein
LPEVDQNQKIYDKSEASVFGKNFSQKRKGVREAEKKNGTKGRSQVPVCSDFPVYAVFLALLTRG